MKLGFSEILILLIMIGVVLFVIRGNPSAKTAPPQKVRVRQPTAAELEEQQIKAARKKRLRWMGGAILVVGLAVLAGSLHVFNLLWSWYTGAALIIVLGIVILALSTRR
jgi:fatty acid desaturase